MKERRSGLKAKSIVVAVGKCVINSYPIYYVGSKTIFFLTLKHAFLSEFTKIFHVTPLFSLFPLGWPDSKAIFCMPSQNLPVSSPYVVKNERSLILQNKKQKHDCFFLFNV